MQAQKHCKYSRLMVRISCKLSCPVFMSYILLTLQANYYNVSKLRCAYRRVKGVLQRM